MASQVVETSLRARTGSRRTLIVLLLLGTQGCVITDHLPLEAREKALRTNLDAIREALVRYEEQEGECVEHLEQLVERGFLPQMPVDPIAREQRWRITRDFRGCIREVFSRVDSTASDGSSYSSW